MYEISSIKNPLIKEYLKLQEKSKYRKETGKFVFEGLQELSFAIKSDYEIDTIFYAKEFTLLQTLKNKNVNCIFVSKQIINSLVYRQGEDNVAIICNVKPNTLPEIGKRSFYLIAENVEKPGNIGAIIRTANAFGASGVILANPLCDLYNPNVIRNSVGTFFYTNLYEISTENVIDWLKNNQVKTYLTHMHQSSIDLSKLVIEFPCAWVLGTENSGVSDEWLNKGFTNCIIPMKGNIDSLNVSNAAAIILYENMKQA